MVAAEAAAVAAGFAAGDVIKHKVLRAHPFFSLCANVSLIGLSRTHTESLWTFMCRISPSRFDRSKLINPVSVSCRSRDVRET